MIRSLTLGAFRRVQAGLYRRGFDVRRFVPVKGIRDAALYGPNLQPWRSAEWQARLRANDPTSLVTPDRKYVLWQFASQAAHLEGDFFECGVYRGGTAVLLAQALAQAGSTKILHLFDTFSGMPETDAQRDLHRAGDFSDASLLDVRAKLAGFPKVAFHPGFVPATFAGLEATRVAFAHVDLDIYEAIRDATAFIYPRLAPSGFIVYDDYGLATCPGARQAVDEFFADKPERVIALESGQGLIVRSASAP